MHGAGRERPGPRPATGGLLRPGSGVLVLVDVLEAGLVNVRVLVAVVLVAVRVLDVPVVMPRVGR